MKTEICNSRIGLTKPFQAFMVMLHDETDKQRIRCKSILMASAVLYLFIQWFIAPVPLVATPNDIMGYIDAGYRVSLGQVPHNDFSTQLGPVFSYLYGLGVIALGPRAKAVVFSNLLMMVVTTSLAWFMSKPRLSPILALIFSVTVMMTTSGVVPLGWGAEATDYAMSYNRHCYGMFMCICIWALLEEKRPSSSNIEVLEALLVGCLVSCLLLLKLNFFVLSVCAVAVSIGISLEKIRRSGWILLGFLLPILFFWLVLGVEPRAFYEDMAYLFNIVTETKRSAIGPIWEMVGKRVLPLGSLVFALYAAGWLFCQQYGMLTTTHLKVFAVAAFLLGADCVLAVSNTQLQLPVLYPIIAIIILNEFQLTFQHNTLEVSLTLALLFILSMTTVIRETYFIAHSAASYNTEALAQQIDSKHLEDIHVPPGETYYYPSFTNDGLLLLRKHVTPDTKLVVLHVSNPFHFSLGLKPTAGTQLYWWENASYTEALHLPAEKVFGSADMVLIDSNSYRLPSSYRQYMERNFAVIDQNNIWLLAKRLRAANKS